MELLWIYDHRFYRDSQGIVYSPIHYNYPFFVNKYLEEFDNIKILARVEDNPALDREGRMTEGDGVQVVSLGNWLGLTGVLPKVPFLKTQLSKYMDTDSAVIMMVPGVLSSLAYRSAIRKQRPYALEIVGDPYDVFAPGAIHHPLRPLFRWWFANNLREQCLHASACHYVTAQALQQRYPPSSLAYEVGYTDAVMTEDAYTPASRSIITVKSKFSLIFVGTLSQIYKAPDILIKAVAQCVQLGLDLELSILGEGKYRPTLEKLAFDLGIQDRICFYGAVPSGSSVRHHLDKADLFVLPSRTEGLPRAMLEAMARALPCIGANVGGIPELLSVDDLFPPDNVTLLADKICEVLSDPQRMTHMSERNWQMSKEYCDEALRPRRMGFYKQVRIQTEQWLTQLQQ